MQNQLYNFCLTQQFLLEVTFLMKDQKLRVGIVFIISPLDVEQGYHIVFHCWLEAMSYKQFNRTNQVFCKMTDMYFEDE